MIVLFLSFLFALTASLAGTRLAIAWLRQRQILDLPNERSSHTRPTPRGGGLAVTPVILLAWLGLAWWCFPGKEALALSLIVAGAFLLLALSWLDDQRGLSARLRFAAHILIAAAGLAVWPADQLLCQGWLPLWADRLVALGAWVWFINLFNFMDGIDGITGVETGSIGAGLVGLGLLANDIPNAALGIVMVGAALGFLHWNWHPAKIFLGDSGSVPIGYLLGWLLLSAAGRGHWAAALILPAYYLADATLTLGKRAFRGERIWQAHRQHFYQQAIQGGANHASVARLILAANALLVGSAWLSDDHPVAALLVAAAVVAGLLALMARLGRRIGR